MPLRLRDDLSAAIPLALLLEAHHVIAWLLRPWDRCRIDGRVIWTKLGYDMCAKHGGR